jgi:hypothetical protein
MGYLATRMKPEGTFSEEKVISSKKIFCRICFQIYLWMRTFLEMIKGQEVAWAILRLFVEGSLAKLRLGYVRLG